MINKCVQVLRDSRIPLIYCSTVKILMSICRAVFLLFSSLFHLTVTSSHVTTTYFACHTHLCLFLLLSFFGIFVVVIISLFVPTMLFKDCQRFYLILRLGWDGKGVARILSRGLKSKNFKLFSK